jgi:hypothetical protein
VNCAVFRNEGPVLSSDLILEAEELAWGRWPGVGGLGSGYSRMCGIRR